MAAAPAVPTCDCLSWKKHKKNPRRFKEHEVQLQPVEVKYSADAEGHVCIYCLRYPTWMPAKKADEPDAWRKEFSRDLQALLNDFGVES